MDTLTKRYIKKDYAGTVTIIKEENTMDYLSLLENIKSHSSPKGFVCTLTKNLIFLECVKSAVKKVDFRQSITGSPNVSILTDHDRQMDTARNV